MATPCLLSATRSCGIQSGAELEERGGGRRQSHRELGRPASPRERLMRQTLLVIDQNEAEWGLLTPYPEHEIQVFGGRTGRKNVSPAGQYGRQR